jgi:CDP-diacylglycerol pyrophosphatase
MLTKSPSPFQSAETKTRRRSTPAIAAIVAAMSLVGIGVAAAVDHDALWKVVHGLCVLDQMHLRSPAPCASVDLDRGEDAGWAVLKDLVGRTQVLLIPTRRLTGIEDPLIGTDAVPNYWSAAWATRNLVAKNAQKDLTRADIGMAINGQGARSQGQLHIHIDCVRPDVRRILESRSGEIGGHWGDFRLLGRHYRARRILGEEPDPDPFRLLAEDKRSAPLGDDSLAVIGATFASGKPGFVLLAARAPGGASHLEDLLDHSCALVAG